MHLIVEATHRRSLSRGMQGLSIRMSKALNKALERRRGTVFTDRYHVEQLRTPRQVRNAMAYVLNNRRGIFDKLGRSQPDPTWVDPFGSGEPVGHVFGRPARRPVPSPVLGSRAQAGGATDSCEPMRCRETDGQGSGTWPLPRLVPFRIGLREGARARGSVKVLLSLPGLRLPAEREAFPPSSSLKLRPPTRTKP